MNRCIKYFKNLPQIANQITLSFDKIEKIIGVRMEDSARRNLVSWDNKHGSGTSVVRQNSWMDAGWETRMVDMDSETVRFKRKQVQFRGTSVLLLCPESGLPSLTLVTIEQQSLFTFPLT